MAVASRFNRCQAYGWSVLCGSREEGRPLVRWCAGMSRGLRGREAVAGFGGGGPSGPCWKSSCSSRGLGQGGSFRGRRMLEQPVPVGDAERPDLPRVSPCWLSDIIVIPEVGGDIRRVTSDGRPEWARGLAAELERRVSEDQRADRVSDRRRPSRPKLQRRHGRSTRRIPPA
jgi:hypothetical protein